MKWKLFRQFSMEMKNAGKESYSAEIIINQIRWHHDIESKGGEAFKINNDYKPMYTQNVSIQIP